MPEGNLTVNALEQAKHDAAALLRATSDRLHTAHAGCDVDEILDQSATAIISGFCAQMSPHEVAEALDIPIAALSLRLSQSSTVIVGIQNLQPGDLIVDLDGQQRHWVVNAKFGALYPGGDRCLGIEHPATSNHTYHLWEGTELLSPESATLRVVRPAAAATQAVL